MNLLSFFPKLFHNGYIPNLKFSLEVKMENKKLKIYIPVIKFPSQVRGVSPPTSLPTPSPQRNFPGEKFHQSSYVLIGNSRFTWALMSKLQFRREFTFNSAQWAPTRKNSKGTCKISTKALVIKSKVEKHVETHVHAFTSKNFWPIFAEAEVVRELHPL